MDIKKPVINILTTESGEKFLKEITAGIEEEGVLYNILKVNENSAEELASEAAEMSLLETGIGLNDEYICVTLHKLPTSKPLYKARTSEKTDLRIAGSNAARIIKGIPLR
jgi:hypothetical protein